MSQLNPSRLTWLRRRPLILRKGRLQTFRKRVRIASTIWHAEIEFRKAQGELVEIGFVQKAAFETARLLNHSLMSLSPQLAPQLATLSDPWEVERQLTAALRRRFNEAAQLSGDEFGFVLSQC